MYANYHIYYRLLPKKNLSIETTKKRKPSNESDPRAWHYML